MGHRNHQEQSHHQAADNLVNLFSKANHDLLVVHYRLEKEFQQIYPDNANPMKLVSRIKKIQEELSSLTEQCRELLSAKQDLIDKARTTLVGNRNLLQHMQAPMGIPVTSDSDDPAFANFNQVSLHFFPQFQAVLPIFQVVSKVVAPLASKQPRSNHWWALLKITPMLRCFIIEEWTVQVRSRIGVSEWDIRPKFSFLLFLDFRSEGILVKETRHKSQSLRMSTNYCSQLLFKATEHLSPGTPGMMSEEIHNELNIPVLPRTLCL
ncbi:Uncharacterized protein TCM_036881 [Theobroma cacao]|uniref:Protein FAM33A n=1 Tax=Theobroma cacao TaxID=3641 RepID=A0A061GQ91_THECC|nr:Uncharacterized protein TCM_036881 [Theobroma cacao]